MRGGRRGAVRPDACQPRRAAWLGTVAYVPGGAAPAGADDLWAIPAMAFLGVAGGMRFDAAPGDGRYPWLQSKEAANARSRLKDHTAARRLALELATGDACPSASEWDVRRRPPRTGEGGEVRSPICRARR
jgi:hypothetical protein